MLTLRKALQAPLEPPQYAPKRAPAPPPIARIPTAHDQFSAEAARAAQRYLDQVEEIKSLTGDRDAWCNRALLAEGEIKRLERRVAELTVQIDNKAGEVARQRDYYKETLAIVGAQYANASKILLDGFAVIRGVEQKIEPLQPAAPEPAEPAETLETLEQALPHRGAAGPRGLD